MRQSRFTEAQIVGILQEADTQGVTVRDVPSRHVVSERTFYRWRRRQGSMQVDEVRRLRELEAQNARLKRLLAESALEIDAIREVLRGKVVGAPARRQVVRALVRQG